jgi:CHAT domain-containing protein/tetratricopeptide (TPR) repeat protein
VKTRLDAGAELLAEGNRLAFLHNWRRAAGYFARAESFYAARGDERNEMYSRVGRLRGEVESLSMPEVSATLAAMLNSPVARRDLRLRLFCLVAKGDIDFQIDPKSSEITWREAESVADHLGERVWKNRARAELGTIAFYKGQVYRAASLVAAGIWAAERTGDTAYAVRLRAVLGEGFAEFGHYTDALEFFNSALQLAARAADIGFPFTAYLGKARALIALGREQEGERILRTALDDARRNHMRIREARVLVVLGDLAGKRGNTIEAAACFRQALALAQGQQLRRLTAAASSRLAGLETEQGLAEAEADAGKGVQNTLAGSDVFDLPRLLATAGQVALKRGDMARARHDYDQAAAVVEQLLRNISYFDQKDFLLSSLRLVYLGQARVALARGSPEEAFEALEHSYARGISESLSFPIDRDQLAPEFTREAEFKVSNLQSLLFHENDSGRRRAILNQIWETEKRGVIIREVDPVPAGRNDIQVSDIERVLRPDELLLEYALDDPCSFLIAIDRRSIAAYRLPSRTVITKLIDEFLSKMPNGNGRGGTGSELRQMLVGPVIDRPQGRWILVANDRLQTIPFEVLLGSDGHYLVENRVITYSPSATVFAQLRLRPRTRPQKGLLGVGGIQYESQDSRVLLALRLRGAGIGWGPSLFQSDIAPRFLALPGSRKELMEAAAAIRKSTLLTDSSATEERLKSQPLDAYGVLHFAVHVAVDQNYPERSGLVLAADAKSHEDGLLQAREIAHLRLGADLVVLSGCNTATPIVRGPSADASLVRAFLFAGARSVLATLWPVNDEFAAYFMGRFYSHFAAGADEGLALSLAKRDAINKFGVEGMPLWGGFRLVGDGSRSIN